MTARVLNVTAEQYFADPCERPSLSQSIAHTLVTRSPLHAWTQHPRLGGKPDEPTLETDEGEVIHSLLLGTAAPVVVVKAENWRTKAAQEERIAARAAGHTPLLERQYEGILAASTKLAAQFPDLGIVFDGESEYAIEWEEPTQYGPVLCRGKLDHWRPRGPQILDVKKIKSADPRTCAAHVERYGYHIQGAAYTSGIAKLYDDFAGRLDFVLVFVEIEPPYAVYPCRLDSVFAARGEQLWRRAVNLWALCTRDKRWPSYTDTIATLDAPGWLVAQMEAEAFNDL